MRSKLIKILHRDSKRRGRELNQIQKNLYGWRREGECLIAGNLKIYFRKSMGEWRLKDTERGGAMDLVDIRFPFDDFQKRRVLRAASQNYKDQLNFPASK